MDEIRIRDKEELTILDISKITEDKLMEIFLERPLQVIYILENGYLIGIISLENFRRNQTKGLSLINK